MDKRSGKEASESLAAIQRDFFLRRTADILDKMLPPKRQCITRLSRTSWSLS